MKLGELAQRLGAELNGPGDIEITGVAGLREARPGQVAYVADEKHLKDVEASRASAVIAPQGMPAVSLPTLRVRNPRFAFAQALGIFHVPAHTATGISDKAAIGRDVAIGAGPSIHPYAALSDGVVVGDRVTVFPGAYVGPRTKIGDDCVIHANVCIREGVTIGSRVIIHAGAVIGSDGFGFVTEGGRHHKIPQVGGVIIEDDVEIGANCAIDRATLGNTVIKKGTKIDNLVQIAHNVIVGEHCLLASQVGIAGSTTLGNYVVFGGQAGAADHLVIGDRVMAGGRSAVTQDVGPGQVIAGHYAMPVRDWLKVQAVLPKLPEMKKRLAELEKRLQALAEDSSEQHGRKP
jgi:UDP-3-O-[3-hydroxymyristoyl] glucosamine N-acyltransferase